MAGRRLAHGECLLRQVVGSVAHLEKRCGCFVAGSTAGDPEGMTPREAAKAATELYEKMMEQRGATSWLLEGDARRGNRFFTINNCENGGSKK